MEVVSVLPHRTLTTEVDVFSWHQFFKCAVKSFGGKTTMRILVILNSILVIAELSVEIRERGARRPLFEILHIFFTTCFTIDFLMKIAFHVTERGIVYLNPLDFLTQPNHIIELTALITSYLLVLWPALVWRQQPTLFQVTPVIRIVKLFRFSHELKVLYRSTWRTVKHAFPAYMVFVMTLLAFGLAGFYLFRDSVPGLFGSVWDSVFRAFAISTKDSWPKTQLAIEEAVGSLTTRWYAVLDIVFLGIFFYNLVVASVTEKVVNTHKRIGEKEQRRRILAVERYREQRNRLTRKRAAKVLRSGRDSLEDIPDDVLNSVAIKKTDMFRTQKWISAYNAILTTLIDDYDDYINQLTTVIEKLQCMQDAASSEDPRHAHSTKKTDSDATQPSHRDSAASPVPRNRPRLRAGHATLPL